MAPNLSIPSAKKNIFDDLDKFVKDEINKGNIKSDDKFAIVGTIDNNGTRWMASISLLNNEKKSLKVAALYEHDWDGDDKARAKLIFSGR